MRGSVLQQWDLQLKIDIRPLVHETAKLMEPRKDGMLMDLELQYRN